MNQRDFLETALPIPAKHLGVRSLLAPGVWRRGAVDVSLAVGWVLWVSTACATTVAGQGDARFEPRRPAPVVGRVGTDAPAPALPVSTAVQVPAPAHLPAAPHDLMAQPAASPVAADTVTGTGSKAAEVAKRPVRAQVAGQGVSRETSAMAKAKWSGSGVAQHGPHAKARQARAQGRAEQAQPAAARRANGGSLAETRGRKAAGRVAPPQAHAAVAPRARHAERVAVATSGRGARHTANLAPRSSTAQAASRASRSSRASVTRTPIRSTQAAARATRSAKPPKHGSSVRSTKAVSAGVTHATHATRRRGA